MVSAPAVTRDDLLAAGLVIEHAGRRQLLRVLAEEVEDFPPSMTARLVARWSHRDLPIAERATAWESLVADTAMLGGLRAGRVDPSVIVPGARPSEAYTVAEQTLLQDIDMHVDTLTRTGAAA